MGIHNPPTVLLVEDDPNVREILGEALAGAGYELESVGTYQEAAQALHDHAHDVVVADIHLPGGMGYDLTHEARSTDTKVILITGHEGELPTAYTHRVSCLVKPFRLEALLDEVREQLGLAKPLDEPLTTPPAET